VAHHVGVRARQLPELRPQAGHPGHVEQAFALPQAGGHPVVVLLQVPAAALAAERAAADGDGPDVADERAQVGSEGS
jgi:hypothetical protein